MATKNKPLRGGYSKDSAPAFSICGRKILIFWFVSCLVPRPYHSTRPMRFGSRIPSEFLRASPSCSSRIRHRNALTEKAWEDAPQRLGKFISMVTLTSRFVKLEEVSQLKRHTLWFWFVRLSFHVTPHGRSSSNNTQERKSHC